MSIYSFPKIHHLGCYLVTTAGLCGAHSRSALNQHLCAELKILLLSLCQQISNISITDHLAEAESPWQTSRRRRRRRGVKSRRHKEQRYPSHLMPRAWVFSSLASLCSFLSLLCAQVATVGFKQRKLGEKSTDSKHSCPLEAEPVGQTVGAGGRLHQRTWDAWEHKSWTQLCLLCAIIRHSHVQFMELGSFFPCLKSFVDQQQNVRWIFTIKFLFTAMMEHRKKNLGFSSSEFGVIAVRNITLWLVERAHLIWELLRQEKSMWSSIICFWQKVALLLTAKGFTPFSNRHFSNRLHWRL